MVKNYFVNQYQISNFSRYQCLPPIKSVIFLHAKTTLVIFYILKKKKVTWRFKHTPKQLLFVLNCVTLNIKHQVTNRITNMVSLFIHYNFFFFNKRELGIISLKKTDENARSIFKIRRKVGSI